MDYSDKKIPIRRATDDLRNRSNIVFVTVCTKNRQKILANKGAHDLLLKVWSDDSQWCVARYVIMPDHIHLFCSPARHEAMNVHDWVTFWKSSVARQWPRVEEKPLWQRGAWDRQLRAGDSYNE